MNLEKKYGLIYVVLIAYAVCIVLYTSYVYFTAKKEFLVRIDNQLHLAAKGANSVLLSEFHSTLFSYVSPPKEKILQVDLLLTEYANAMDVAYVYTLKRFDDDIRFIVSSLTPEEQRTQSHNAAYYEKYDDMDPAINLAFETGEIQFAEYRDKWGNFRSIFYPFFDTAGQMHVVGVDVKIDVVKELQKKSVFYAVFGCLVFLFVTLPLVFMVIRSIDVDYRRRIEVFTIDPLTGLPNKNQLLNDLEDSTSVYLSLISISGLGAVAAVHGLSIGDQILKQFAIRLSHFEHPSIKQFKCYYIHGKDFAIVVKHPIPKADEEWVANSLIDLLSAKDYQISADDSAHLSCCIGGVQGDESRIYSPEDLFSMAHIASVEAKSKQQSILFFRANNEYLPSSYKDNFRRVDEIKKALNENRIRAHYHAIFRAGSKTDIVRYECLARLVDDKNNVILLPDEFIPCAHRAKLYSQITIVIIDDAISFVQKTNKDVSVNLSVRDITSRSMSNKIYRRIKRSGIASKILFELLEDEYIGDYRPIVRFIIKFKKIGVRFGVDDVGKNYSNFDRLISLPVDFIKIDGSVIRFVDSREDARKVVREIVSIANTNSVSVVAEYCSSESTTEMAVSLGVDYLQGFYLAKPESRDAIVADLDRNITGSIVELG